MLPASWRRTYLVRVVRRAAINWSVCSVPGAAAAIAYYAIFALAPMLVFVTTAANRFLSQQDARDLAVSQIAVTFGEKTGDLANSVLETAQPRDAAFWVTALSTVLLLYGASSMFLQVRLALNQIFGHEYGVDRGAALELIFGRLRSAAFVIGGGFVFLASLLVSVLFHSAIDQLSRRFGIISEVWNFTAPLVSFGVVAIVLVAAFRLLPTKRPPYRYLVVGALVSALLFEIGKWALALYVSHSLIASAYGPSSSLVAFLVWIYYSAQIILLGAVLSEAMHSESLLDRS